MKKSKLPLAPLYVADALVIVLVLATSLPSAFRGEAISTTQTFLCCIAVLLSMFMVLLPYFWEYKKDLATKHEHTDQAKENFDIIFNDLQALRLSIADALERVENLELGTADITQLQKNLINLKDSAKNKFVESAKSVEELSASISNLEDAIASTKTSLEELGADLVVIKELAQANNDSILAEVDDLRKQIATMPEIDDSDDDSYEGVIDFDDDEDDVDETEADEVVDPIEDQEEASAEVVEDVVEENVIEYIDSQTNDADFENVEDFDTNDNTDDIDDSNEFDDPDEFDDEDEFDDDQPDEVAPAPRGKVEVGHLLKRALQNADDTKLSVEKFINRNKQSEPVAEEVADEIAVDSAEENKAIDDDADFFNEVDSPEIAVESTENESEEVEVIEENEELEDDIPEESNTPVLVAEPPDTNALLKRFDSEYEIKQAEKHLPKPEKKEKVVPLETESLFDELPVSRGKIKPKKGDTVITVNALIGIGNSPYLRGDGAGLSQDKGIAMHYMEIGKWQYVIPELDQPLNFSVLKNDTTLPQGESNFTINAGERKELNLFFPMEQELF